MTVNCAESSQSRRGSGLSVHKRRTLASAVYRCFQNYYHGHHIFDPDPMYICGTNITLKHWQLKDLIQIDHTTGSLYYTSDESIRIMLLKNARHREQPFIKSREAFSLPYSPQCFNHAPGGMVVTGGISTVLEKAYSSSLASLMPDFGGGRASKGLFSVYSPSMQEELSFRLGDMINNAVTIYPEASGYKSFVCNNDLHLYMVDILNHGVRGEQKVVCEENISLNNVLQAPNGRDLAVTGDSGNMYVVDPRAPECIQTLVTGHDSGFGLSFHANGSILAGSFQDGTCLLYDLRNVQQPLRVIKSSRPGNQSGAFRCCKFLQTSAQDMLAISEDVGRVHVVDYKNLSEDSHQVIVFPHALDQFAKYTLADTAADEASCGSLELSLSSSSASDILEPTLHCMVDIYDDANYFNAPLVYDYDYVTNVSPKLFKDFIFEPLDPKNQNASADGARARIGYPSYRARTHAVQEDCTDHERLVQYQRYYHELYQQSMNHICGEMKISGIDWHDNLLFVGGLDGGVLRCDINVRARRSFGSFSYA